MEADPHRQAASRAYCGLFYALLGLLAWRGLGTSKHQNAINLFHREYIRNGLFGTEYGKILQDMRHLRLRADYYPRPNVTPGQAESALATAERFVAEARGFLEER